MAVTKLEQWKNERKNRPEPIVVAEKTHVVEIECAHCRQHFFRWISTASVYWRCEDCTQSTELVPS